jgi:hypothetical protein
MQIAGQKLGRKPDRFPSEVTIASDRSSEKDVTLTFEPNVLDEISKGIKILSAKGQIRYTDIFKDWHVTTFCAAYDSVTKTWLYCPGNDVQ